jgi:hypothetical protein
MALWSDGKIENEEVLLLYKKKKKKKKNGRTNFSS